MNTLPLPELSSLLCERSAFDVVAIGASLGGIKALRFLLSALPCNFCPPIVIVQHISPQYPSRLAQLLSFYTPLATQSAMDGLRLQQGTIYTAPPNRHLTIDRQHTFRLRDTPRIKYSRPAVDPLFQSVADVFGPRAIGVILTGANDDGADGIRAIKHSGGTTIAQDPATSRAFRMPSSAIRTRCVNFVLPLERIAPALVALTAMPGASSFFTLPLSASYPIPAGISLTPCPPGRVY